MTRLIRSLAFGLVLACAVTAQAGTYYSTAAPVMMSVRHQTTVYSTSLLPDSTLLRFVSRAIVQTSTDGACIQRRFRFNTTANREFYPVGDSVVDIISVIAINDPFTKSMLPINPSLFESILNINKLSSMTPDVTPVAYWRVGDSLQLMPGPLKVDSISVTYTVAHPSLTTTGQVISLPDRAVEAAIYYAAKLVHEYLKETQTAAYHEALYDKLVAKLRLSNLPAAMTKG